MASTNVDAPEAPQQQQVTPGGDEVSAPACAAAVMASTKCPFRS